jgi:pilus assembly protein CpaF
VAFKSLKVPETKVDSPLTVEVDASVLKRREWETSKSKVRDALVEVLDAAELSAVSRSSAIEILLPTVRLLVKDHNFQLGELDLRQMCKELVDEIVGLGPLEDLLSRDDIADIMVNGYDKVFIEVNGRVELTAIKFSSEQQLLQICQRIVRLVGRRVDESSPICDARLLDGSRVNVIIPPLAIDGSTLTIRKFKKERLDLKQLVKFDSITQDGASLLSIISKIRCNVVVSGGTGSGKTTLLNCLTGQIDVTERIVTCEDTAELQLQQDHVVRLETRPPNMAGSGPVTMGDW